MGWCAVLFSYKCGVLVESLEFDFERQISRKNGVGVYFTDLVDSCLDWRWCFGGSSRIS